MKIFTRFLHSGWRSQEHMRLFKNLINYLCWHSFSNKVLLAFRKKKTCLDPHPPKLGTSQLLLRSYLKMERTETFFYEHKLRPMTSPPTIKPTLSTKLKTGSKCWVTEKEKYFGHQSRLRVSGSVTYCPLLPFYLLSVNCWLCVCLSDWLTCCPSSCKMKAPLQSLDLHQWIPWRPARGCLAEQRPGMTESRTEGRCLRPKCRLLKRNQSWRTMLPRCCATPHVHPAAIASKSLLC